MPSPSPNLPLLYSFRRCPYAMRARMALLQAGRPFQVIEVSLRNKPAELLALSPKGTVPVLLLPDGQVLEESWDIMRWAWSGDDSAGWWSRAQSTENLDLLRCNDGQFKRHLDRYKYPDRYPDEQLPREVRREQAVQALPVLLEARLGHQAYLGGARPCAVDLAIIPFVRQFAAVEPLWFAGQNLPALRAWLSAWQESLLFETCMTKIPGESPAPFPNVPGG